MLDYMQAQQFLFREARYMDTHAYDDWLALWAKDAHYWIPCNDDDIDPRRHISLVNENRDDLLFRVQRLKSGAHYAQDPKSRLSRVISNVEIAPGATASTVTIYSNFNLSASRKARIDIIAGRSEHTLILEDGELRMARKRIILIDNDEVIKNLTYLV